MFHLVNLDLIAGSNVKFRSESLTDQNILRVVRWPTPFDPPPRKSRLRASGELLRSKFKRFRKICAEQSEISPGHLNTRRQLGRKRRNIVAPENSFHLRQSAFVEICSVASWLQIYAANLYVERILFRRDHKVSPIASKFVADLVADSQCHPNHRRGNRCPKRHSNRDQQFSLRLPPERFINKSNKHDKKSESRRQNEQVRFQDSDFRIEKRPFRPRWFCIRTSTRCTEGRGKKAN